MRNLTVLLALTLATFSTAASAGDVMRCRSRLISTEALAAEVLGACGEPDFIDRWEPPGSTLPLAALADVEEWYYNFGPSQLLRILHFQRGRLVDIESDGYGFPTSIAIGCDPYRIVEGLSKYRLRLACGEPVTRRAEYAVRPLHQPEVFGHSPRGARRAPESAVPVYSEEWVYNFGAHNMLRVVTLENGRVADVRGEGRGFNP